MAAIWRIDEDDDWGFRVTYLPGEPGSELVCAPASLVLGWVTREAQQGEVVGAQEEGVPLLSQEPGHGRRGAP